MRRARRRRPAGVRVARTRSAARGPPRRRRRASMPSLSQVLGSGAFEAAVEVGLGPALFHGVGGDLFVELDLAPERQPCLDRLAGEARGRASFPLRFRSQLFVGRPRQRKVEILRGAFHATNYATKISLARASVREL